jgi:uncharacterized repeat protein (TIGR03803 family)
MNRFQHATSRAELIPLLVGRTVARKADVGTRGKISLSKVACIVIAFCAATATAAPAQTFKTLVSFDFTDGAQPYFMSLIQGRDGSYYGTTLGGGVYKDGTVFKISAGGKLSRLHSFDGTDGYYPSVGLVQGTDGNFYGTNPQGGTSENCDQFGITGCGTVFKITPGGKLSTLHNFDLEDGSSPFGVLVQGTDGNFYGTTQAGGASVNCPNGCGTVFKISAGGKFSTLHSFDGTDGDQPSAGLIQAADGSFYGTTMGGEIGYGTVFKITLEGKLTTLHSFDGTGGECPTAGLVHATDGNFYGTTSISGNDGYGTVFKITPQGELTTLYQFVPPEGNRPYAGLVQGTDGNFYGTTSEGGADGTCDPPYGCGTVFKITSAGELTTLHTFNGTDGAYPFGALLQATDGTFYGTTAAGGAKNNSSGTVFSLSVGLRPFVETMPTSGKVGAKVIILGTDLTGATSVRFNGTPAKFKVASESEIETDVPSGATSGTVEVKIAKNTLKSNVAFRVTK